MTFGDRDSVDARPSPKKGASLPTDGKPESGPHADAHPSFSASPVHMDTYGDPAGFRNASLAEKARTQKADPDASILPVITKFGGFDDRHSNGVDVTPPDAAAGHQYVLTANHAVASMPGWGETYSSVTEFGLLDKNKNGEVSKDELRGFINKVLPNTPDTLAWNTLAHERAEMTHLLAHYDDALKTTQGLNPKAQGLTPEGIQKYFDDHTRTKVDVGGTKFDARVVAKDPKTDLALLDISHLNSQQAKRFPAPLTISGEPVKQGDVVRSEGYVDGKLESIEADVVKRFHQSDNQFDAEQFKTDALLTPGVSGGPTFRMKGGEKEFVGINHAHGNNTGLIIDSTEVQSFLGKYFQRGKKPESKIH